MSAFKLNDTQANDALWRNLKAHMESRLVGHRVKNDNTDLTPEQTATLRGQIKELKYLLTLDKPPPADQDPHVEP